MCMAKQIFLDDFNGPSLDTTKWSVVRGKLDTENGTQMRFSGKNVSVMRGSILSLNGTVATGADVANAPFLSGMVSTRNSDKGQVLFQAKGQFVVSIHSKTAKPPTSWTRIRLVGTKGDWPACGGIDILEAKGWLSNNYWMNVHNPRAGEPTKSQQHQATIPENISRTTVYDHHKYLYTYSVAKLNDRIDFYLNNDLVHTVKYSEMDDPTPFTDPENGWIIELSHIIGGSFLDSGGTEEGHDQYVDATKYKNKYPFMMLVDYVRVISLDEPGTVDPMKDQVNIAGKYAHVTTQPEPPVIVPPTPDPPVVVPPTPEPEPVPEPEPEPVPEPAPKQRAKNDWVREEDCLVFIML
nr:MAG TPA: hypothetical protein [Caudoviricetes sp.]